MSIPSKRKRFIHSPWAPVLVGISLLSLMVLIRIASSGLLIPERGGEPDEFLQKEELALILKAVLQEHNVSWSERKTASPHWTVRVPRDLPVPSLHYAIQSRIDAVHARIVSAGHDPGTGAVYLAIGWQDSTVFRLDLRPEANATRGEGRIALIIDDFGDRWNSFVGRFFELGAEISVSVIPGHRMSRQVAETIRQKGFEILLHLPMEPLDDSAYRPNDYIVMAGMSKQRIQEIFSRCVADVPGAVGVNNHMGSKATADQETMRRVLEEVRANNLFFIDSRTTANTLGHSLAKTMLIPTSQRDVFIDVEDDLEAIRRRLWELAERARSNGISIGIGHCRQKTLTVLQQEIPKLQAKGYLFVPISHTVR